MARSSTNESAREYLLDVAETILSAEGLSALTIRRLTQDAGMNVASVNYFFGTKDSLLIALQQRLYVPMTQERLERFDALEAQGRSSVRAIVQALIEPLADMRERHGRSAVELYRYLLARPDPAVYAAGWGMLEPGLRRFEAMVLAALPDRAQEALQRRVHLICQLVVPAALRALEAFETADDPDDLDDLVDFIVGGLVVADSRTRSGIDHGEPISRSVDS